MNRCKRTILETIFLKEVLLDLNFRDVNEMIYFCNSRRCQAIIDNSLFFLYLLSANKISPIAQRSSLHLRNKVDSTLQAQIKRV